MPFRELKAQFGVENTSYCFIPSTSNQFWDLVEVVKNFDLVIIQRCYNLSSVSVVKAVCEFLGKALVFETDDDYLSLEPDNPAYYAIARDQNIYREYKEASSAEKKAEILPRLEESRLQGLEDYKQLLRMVDAVTVTNDILARTIYPYNKDVKVLQNNIDRLFPWRDSVDLSKLPTDASGVRYEIPNIMGFWIVPDHVTETFKGNTSNMNYTSRKDFVRILYSTSPSRRGKDWETVVDTLNDWSLTTKQEHMIVTIEDVYSDIVSIGKDAEGKDILARTGYFFNSLKNKNRAISIPQTSYDKYMQNYRNGDIALAPLEPTPFNTSRSEIKLLEAAAWKIPGLVPRLQTYSRGFVDGVNCLMYSNEQEFKSQLDKLASSPALRKRLGEAAYEYVATQRLEKFHAAERYEFYKEVISEKKPMERVCTK